MIIDCSEKKASQLCHPEWKLKRESLNAFIVILIFLGATRGGKESIKCVGVIFTKNCQNCLVPESQMCVDEQLIGFRGRCPFRVYMKSKPDLYGIKIWANCKNPLGYV